MMNMPNETQARRKELKARYKGLYGQLASILFEEDPAGINFEDNTDEYEPEVDTILPRLKACRSVGDIRDVVHEEFVRWFDAHTAGPPERYAKIAERIWSAMVSLPPEFTA